MRRIVCLGGGPAGLYAAILLRKALPSARIEVYERNRPDDTFGWGVVFSDQTMGNFRAADPETHSAILVELPPLGRHRHSFRRPAHLSAAATASRNQPQAPAEPAPGAGPGAGRAPDLSASRWTTTRRLPGRGPHHRRGRRQQPDAQQLRPMSSSPTSTCASAASSGWARLRNSMPSPSPSSGPSTVGSRSMPISSARISRR